MLLGAASIMCVIAGAHGAQAEDVTGKLVIIDWLGGSEADMMHKLEADFASRHPGLVFKEIIPQTSGDIRGGIRQVLMGGEQADVLIDTWPSFRKELVASSLIQPIDKIWADNNLDSKLGKSWKALATIGDHNYGVTYTFGDRSEIWYKTSTLEKAGVTPPKTWDEFVASFKPLRANGVVPMSVSAKVWAHAAWFESMLLRTSGAKVMRKLIAHEIPWTDDAVKAVFKKWAGLLKAGCCNDSNTMMALNWDNSADAVLKAGTAAYDMFGMSLNTRAEKQYGMVPGKDYSLFQFPSMGMGHDDESMVDSKELNLLSTAQNPGAVGAFMAYMVSKDAAAIMAKYGMPSPSTAADISLYDPVVQKAVEAVSSAKDVEFVLGDQLPADLTSEYRVQMQKFLIDPSDANIDKITAAIEAVAAGAY